MWKPREKRAIYDPKREIAEETHPANTLILDFSPLELWKNTFLSHPACGTLFWQSQKTKIEECTHMPGEGEPVENVPEERQMLNLVYRDYLLCSQSCPTLYDPMDCSIPGFPDIHYLWQFAQTHVHWVDDAIQPSHPLSSPSSPALNLSQYQGLFQRVSCRIRWLKYWSLSFSISPPNEYSELISFRTDWFDLAVQGIPKNLLQDHILKASRL